MIELFLTFLKISLVAFGGGYATLTLIQNEVVNTHHWINIQKFLQILPLAQMTPGPILTNIATYIGFILNGITGSILATSSILISSYIWIGLILTVFKIMSKFMDIERLYKSLRIAVISLILSTTITVGIHSITNIQSFLILIFLLYLAFKTKIKTLPLVFLSGFITMIVYMLI
jgi:chromate transporter